MKRTDALVAEQVRVDDLHRDGAPESLLLGAVHPPHATDPDELEDPVAAGKRGADQGVISSTVELGDGEAANRAELMRRGAQVATLRAHDIRHKEHPITGGYRLADPLPPSSSIDGRLELVGASSYRVGAIHVALTWDTLRPHGYSSPASRTAARRRQAHHRTGLARGPRSSGHGWTPARHAARRGRVHQRDTAHADPQPPAERAVGLAPAHRVLAAALEPGASRRGGQILPRPDLRAPRAQPGRHALRGDG